MLLYRLHYIIIKYYYDYLIKGFIGLGECVKELESYGLYKLVVIVVWGMGKGFYRFRVRICGCWDTMLKV